MSKKDADSISDYVSRFSHHVGNAIKSIENAAKLYAEAIVKYGKDAQEAFVDAYPHVTPNTWEKFLAVGNGDANPNIMLFSDKFAKRICRMSRNVQDEVLNGGSFSVFNPTTRTIEQINYGSVKPRHERILFDDSRSSIRTIPEQIAYLKVVDSERKKHNLPYCIHSDHLEVTRACTIGKEELENIVEEMA